MPKFYLGWACPGEQTGARPSAPFASHVVPRHVPFEYVCFPNQPNLLTEVITVEHKAIVEAADEQDAWALVAQHFPKPIKKQHSAPLTDENQRYYEDFRIANGAEVHPVE
jgi:hypothetical protein